jgi:hypothetical protein
VSVEKIFDFLVPYHFANQHAKGKILWKAVKSRLHHVTEEVCHMLCVDCPTCLHEKEQKKPRAGTQPIITHGMNMRGQVCCQAAPLPPLRRRRRRRRRRHRSAAAAAAAAAHSLLRLPRRLT